MISPAEVRLWPEAVIRSELGQMSGLGLLTRSGLTRTAALFCSVASLAVSHRGIEDGQKKSRVHRFGALAH